jgi:hypothetical protein
MENTIQSLPSLGILLQETWGFYKARFVTLMGVLLPSAVLFGLSTAGDVDSGLSTILAVVSAIASLWTMTALNYAIVHTEINDIMQAYSLSYKMTSSRVWISILGSLIVMGGVLLFIIPGIIFAMWYFAAEFLLFTDGLTGMNALRASKALVTGRTWGVFWRLSIGGLIISVPTLLVASVPIFGVLVYIATAPLTTIYAYILFKHMKGGVMPVTIVTS